MKKVVLHLHFLVRATRAQKAEVDNLPGSLVHIWSLVFSLAICLPLAEFYILLCCFYVDEAHILIPRLDLPAEFSDHSPITYQIPSVPVCPANLTRPSRVLLSFSKPTCLLGLYLD